MKHTGVKERIAQLHAEQNAKSEMSRDESRRFLVEVIRAKPENAY
jgi:polyhydroxyalkanoate synthesis regulator phasin